MYYIIIESYGKKKCIKKGQSDSIEDSVNANCDRDLEFPPNIVLLRDIVVRCISGNHLDGKVFADYMTGTLKLNLTNITTISNVKF